MKKVITTLSLILIWITVVQAQSFCIAEKGNTASIIIDKNDWKGVIRAANDLGDDVRKVCGKNAGK